MSSVPPDLGGLFGTFQDLSRDQQIRVSDYLRLAWRAQYGQEVGLLSSDLERMTDLYAPAVQAKKLRALADQLQPVTTRRPPIDAALYVSVDENRGFVTPEGRLLLEVSPETHAPSVSQLLRLVEFYSVSRREWMARAFEGGDLRPATLGFVLFLLINGSSGAGRALRIPTDPSDERRVAAAVVGVVNAFVVGIGGKALDGREASQLSGNWAVTESGRQLPGLVRHIDGAKRRVERIYVEPGREDAVIAAIAKSLRGRPRVDGDVVAKAFDASEVAYAEVRPSLRAWGLSWETSESTGRLRDLMLRGFAAAG